MSAPIKPSNNLLTEESPGYGDRLLRPRERLHLPRDRNFQAEGQIGRQRAQQAAQVERAFAGKQAVAARLADDLLHVRRPPGMRVAELDVAHRRALQVVEGI